MPQISSERYRIGFDIGGTFTDEAGVNAARVMVKQRAEMRLFGQMHEITVALPDGALTADSIEPIRAVFTTEYTRRYTELYRGATIQILNWRIEYVSPLPALVLQLQSGNQNGSGRKGSRPAAQPEAAPVMPSRSSRSDAAGLSATWH